MGLDLSGNGSSETRLDRDPAHSAHGFGQQVASLVLWFDLDDWVIGQIDREATRTLMPSPPRRNNLQQQAVSPVTAALKTNMQLRPTSLIGPRGCVALAPFITDAVTTAYGADKSDLVFRTASQGTSIRA